MRIEAIVVLLLIVCLAALSLLVRRRDRRGREWPFYAKRPLSQPEQVLYHRLVAALPERMVLAQVQVSRVLGVKKGFNIHEWNNRINRMSYDFVVCAKDSSVLAVIELDDKSHEAESRRKTDAKKNSASSAAGIRVIRWNVKALPDQAAIREAFADMPSVRPQTHFGAHSTGTRGDLPSPTVK